MENSPLKNSLGLNGYRPELDSTYMSDEMVAYFHNKLVGWKNSLIKSEQYSVDSLADVTTRENDPLDNCSNKEINYPQVACIEHKKMLLRQIDTALSSIENGSYGYCEHTGNPIGVARLESYPIARLCVWAQEQLEKLANMNSRSFSSPSKNFY